MPFFTHQKIQFHYREHGNGVPFVFQHGLGVDLNQSFALLPGVPGFRVMAFDCRAHGATAPTGGVEELGLTTFADDLGAFLEHLKIERAVVGGTSMGAAVALNYTLRNPDKVLGLVMSRPAWLDAPNPWNVMMFSLITSLVRQHGPVRGEILFRQSPQFLNTQEQWPETAEFMAAQFRDPAVEHAAVKFERIIKDTPCRERAQWKAIQVPTLVLANREDPIHPIEYGQVLAHGIPGAQFEEVTSKAVSVEAHESEVGDRIRKFLAQHEAAFRRSQRAQAG